MICDGCNVREPWEHRCWGGKCTCGECRGMLVIPETATAAMAADGAAVDELVEMLVKAMTEPIVTEVCPECGEEIMPPSCFTPRHTHD